MANTSSPLNPLVTALPNEYYPESIWHDDMEFGGAEIALAAQALGHDASSYLSQAATWAHDYITSDTGGLGSYQTGMVACHRTARTRSARSTGTAACTSTTSAPRRTTSRCR